MDDFPNKVCGEPGRQMFFQYAGQYFAAHPKLMEAPAGTPCGICGASDVKLWLTSAGATACLAQHTITRKRAARKNAAVPLTLPANPSDLTDNAMSSMAKGTMIVAGPRRAMIVTKLMPERAPPPGMEIRFSDKGSIRAGKRELLENPPPAPFVAIMCGEKANYTTRITADASQIIINGPDGRAFNRPYLRRLIGIVDRIGLQELRGLAELRLYMAMGQNGTSQTAGLHDRMTLAWREFCSSRPVSQTEFRSLPKPKSPEFKLLEEILS
jgi:hypothetical protein